MSDGIYCPPSDHIPQNLGEFDFRIRKQLQIAGTRDDKFDSNGIIGLTFVLLIEEVILKSSHPPEKSAAYLLNKGFTPRSPSAESKLFFLTYAIASIGNALNGHSAPSSLQWKVSCAALTVNLLACCVGNKYKLMIDCRLIISTLYNADPTPIFLS